MSAEVTVRVGPDAPGASGSRSTRQASSSWPGWRSAAPGCRRARPPARSRGCRGQPSRRRATRTAGCPRQLPRPPHRDGGRERGHRQEHPHDDVEDRRPNHHQHGGAHARNAPLAVHPPPVLAPTVHTNPFRCRFPVPSWLLQPLWDQFAALLPDRPVYHPSHPLGCHKPRIADRIIFERLIQVLRFGCSYASIADCTCDATTIRGPPRRVDPGGDLRGPEDDRPGVL
jgi:hypothetical protein